MLHGYKVMVLIFNYSQLTVTHLPELPCQRPVGFAHIVKKQSHILSTFLRHKQRFYNETECTWTKDSTIASSSDEMDNAGDLEFESVSPQAISSDEDLNMQG